MLLITLHLRGILPSVLTRLEHLTLASLPFQPVGGRPQAQQLREDAGSARSEYCSLPCAYPCNYLLFQVLNIGFLLIVVIHVS